MPGIFFLYKKNPEFKVSLNAVFQRVRNIINITGLEYTEFFTISHNTILHNIYPAFIDEKRFFENDEFIAAMDGDYYNLNELNKIYNRSYNNKMEMILFLYSRYNYEAGSYLNGEFVILIQNKKNDNTIIINDRYARRPIFYYHDDNLTIFSSEKKSILATGLIKKELDVLGVLQVFAYRHNLGSRTFINNIKTLPPASYIFFRNESFQIKPYFYWEYNSIDDSKNNLIDEFYEKSIAAIERRITDKSRVLLWLSGGMDSRHIAGALNRLNRLDIMNITYGEDYSLEIDIAKKVAEILNLPWRKERVNGKYTNVAQFGAWRTEFAIPALEHAYTPTHSLLKKQADYIISGLPGNATLIGKVLSPKLYFLSKNRAFLERFIKMKIPNKELLKDTFNDEFIEDNYSSFVDSFKDAFNKINGENPLDKISLFNQLERQPHYSYLSDLVENDIFETLHPFADSELLDFYLKVPLKFRYFDKLARDLIYNYFPELRNIPLDGNRGKLRSDDTYAKYILQRAYAKYFKKEIKSQNWNRSKAIVEDWSNIKKDITSILNRNEELKHILNYKKILSNIESPEHYSNIPYKFDLLITFLYSYRYFLEDTKISIPDKVLTHYSQISL